MASGIIIPIRSVVCFACCYGTSIKRYSSAVFCLFLNQLPPCLELVPPVWLFVFVSCGGCLDGCSSTDSGPRSLTVELVPSVLDVASALSCCLARLKDPQKPWNQDQAPLLAKSIDIFEAAAEGRVQWLGAEMVVEGSLGFRPTSCVITSYRTIGRAGAIP